MEKAVTSGLSIDVDWAELPEGEPEERACGANLGIRCDGIWMTEGHDAFSSQTRHAPTLSAYHLAEWLAWNWWRLRYEPLPPDAGEEGWAFAHCLPTIGQGYVWPNMTIFSTGETTVIVAKPSQDRTGNAFRYIANHTARMSFSTFDQAMDGFVQHVLERLHTREIADSNLKQIWAEVCAERGDANQALRRMLEAAMGHDPDEAPAGLLDRLVADTSYLGRDAVFELAAERFPDHGVPSAGDLESLAERKGYAADWRNSIQVDLDEIRTATHDLPAWEIGADMARRLRARQELGSAALSNSRLAEMAGLSQDALTGRHKKSGESIAFAMAARQGNRMVLRSNYRVGRRFEVARLLGDRLAHEAGGSPLFPATQSYTRRQQAQRAFAAELLCPFEALDAMLKRDYSEEKIQQVANHFDVSERAVLTQLVNHRKLGRHHLDPEGGNLAA
jgi:Zn-dependent peptidase ImmA (M78 family)